MLKSDELAKAADGNQLFHAFARAMNQALTDHARRRKAEKRGGDCQREELDDLADHVGSISRSDVLALHEALDALAALPDLSYARAAAVVEMRFFGGCTMKEIAEALDVSLSTVEKDYQFGRAWLHRFLTREDAS